jgi:hypothetical protein
MRVLVFVLWMIGNTATAQQADPLLFREKNYDFGEIDENGGNAEHDFIFTNNSGRAIKILSVQASCGCTTPAWTKETIQPGKTGFVKASFDPRGRPGYFNKTLTVTTDLESGSIALQIKGQVASKKPVVAAIDFPVVKGSLRFKSNAVNFEKVYLNAAPVKREFTLYNAGSKAIHFIGQPVAAPYIKAEPPAEIGPLQKGVIKITYDAKLRNRYGFVSDNLELGTDDDIEPVKSFAVYATIEESFPPLSANELAKAPVLVLAAPDIDFGRLHAGATATRDIEIKNTGKKELIIRALQENCSCVTASLTSMKIAGGASANLTISLNTEGRAGIQQKAVTLYSNDPRSPVQRITVTAFAGN